jgi:CRP-like cAMP-binding protein
MANLNGLLQLLLTDDFRALDARLKSVALTEGAVLAEPGDEIRNVYFPHSGIVSFMVGLDDGAMVQTFMVGRDGVVGAAQALDSKTSVNKILVQVSGTASVIDRDPLREIVERNPRIRSVLAAHEQFLVADIQQTAACNARHSVEARAAKWILRMRDLVGDDLPLTQDYLASMIGVRRSSVTDIAGAMQTAGAISYARGRLHVTNPEALGRMTCECHRAVRKNYLSLLGTSWPPSQTLKAHSQRF